MTKGKINIFGFLLLAIGVVLMASGVMNGEHTEVFQKAIRICLECIGIG